MPGCGLRCEKGLETPGTPCTPHSLLLLQSVPVHWSNSPRCQGLATVTSGSAALRTPPLSPLQKVAPKLEAQRLTAAGWACPRPWVGRVVPPGQALGGWWGHWEA